MTTPAESQNKFRTLLLHVLSPQNAFLHPHLNAGSCKHWPAGANLILHLPAATTTTATTTTTTATKQTNKNKPNKGSTFAPTETNPVETQLPLVFQQQQQKTETVWGCKGSDPNTANAHRSSCLFQTWPLFARGTNVPKTAAVIFLRRLSTWLHF